MELMPGQLLVYSASNPDVLVEVLSSKPIQHPVSPKKYLESEEYRRRINAQLNKGEALHALRRFLFFANEGKIRRKDEEDQLNQASCLNLVTNAVVAWNTVYLTAALDALTVERYPVQENDLVHLSPARYEHINPYGKYRFEVEAEWSRKTLRPLRHP
jgi:rRNA maturation protein Nop10